MSAARFVCAAFAFGAAYLYGEVAKARLRYRTDELHAVAEAVPRLASMLELDRLPLEEAFAALAGEERLHGFWQGMALDTARGLSPEKAYKTHEGSIFNGEAREALSELFAGLGSGDADTEARRVRACCQRLEDIKARAVAEAEKKLKLTGSLSVMLGLAAALLLL